MLAVLAIAAVVGVAVLSGMGSTPATRQTAEVAPPAAAAAETATATPSTGRPKADSANKVVTATDAHGRTFSCSFAYEDRLNAAQGRVNRRRRTLRAQEAELTKLDKQYPGRTAPAAVADHYNTLAAQARAQVKSTNMSIRAYNQLLIDLCDPT